MKNLLLLFGTLLVLAFDMKAQTDAVPLILQKEEPYYGIGLQAGLATGSGIMFRAIIPDRFAAEATIGVITLGDYTYFSSGLEGQFR
ncbi:MAG TPA: hypothetical protein PLI74_05035, partial [Candidatus Kapabacteria bacterium]|nr:hypothetical protein [Candidatus Kapabacteria bacterium]